MDTNTIDFLNTEEVIKKLKARDADRLMRIDMRYTSIGKWFLSVNVSTAPFYTVRHEFNIDTHNLKYNNSYSITQIMDDDKTLGVAPLLSIADDLNAGSRTRYTYHGDLRPASKPTPAAFIRTIYRLIIEDKISGTGMREFRKDPRVFDAFIR